MMHIVVIGGGPAGMIAACTAAQQGAKVTLLEKNEKLGKKLYITGKGRCNLTNNTNIEGLLAQVNTNPRFLQSAFHAMDASALIQFFESRGTPLKTERGGRVFPVSDKADDITKTLTASMREHRVHVKLGQTVTHICNKLKVHTASNTYDADAIILATGGLSYPSTGSTGDGYKFATSLGHIVTNTYPALVPLEVKEPWVAALEGLSLRNVCCTVLAEKILFAEQGEMLFTRRGVTGPIILRASSYVTEKFETGTKLLLNIDLKPALTHQQLDARILRDFAAGKNKNFANALDDLLPKRLIDTIITLSGIPPDKKVHTINKAERKQLAQLLKTLPLTPTKTTGYSEAVITRGGVDIKHINPSTMMSKVRPGIFFAGELLDTDAMTGGYNLQIAFSTGFLAGKSAAKYTKE